MIPRLFVCIFLVGAGKGDREGERGGLFLFIYQRDFIFFFMEQNECNCDQLTFHYYLYTDYRTNYSRFPTPIDRCSIGCLFYYLLGLIELYGLFKRHINACYNF